MKFEWDENKNQQNIAKHGVSFDIACRIFEGFTLGSIDDRHDYGETREISIGVIDGVAYVTIAHTDRGGICRIISARPASRSERKRYDTEIQKAFDA
jgi:uncharacterized DUF497 family protein